MNLFLVFTGFSCSCIGLICGYIYGKERKKKEVKDIVRKYQKIREIAFPLQFCSTDKLEHEAIMKICEVLEDGNN